MSNKIRLLAVLIFLLCGTRFAKSQHWQTYTNMYDIRDIAIHQENIWCATNGGIFKYNTNDSTFELFTNIDGLSELDVRSIEVDSDGDIWIGTYNGVINLLHPDSREMELIDDYRRHVIYDIKTINQDSLLIAFDNGIGLYVKGAREVRENYYKLGENTRFEAKIHVNRLFVNQDTIWAATDVGIAMTSLDKLNLNDPASWTNYTVQNGLPGSLVKDIIVTQNVVYAITDQGIAKRVNSTWIPINNGIPPKIISEIHSFFENSDTLYVAADYGVYRYDATQDWWFHPYPDLGYANVLVCDANGIWVGRNARDNLGGIAYIPFSGTEWKEVYPPGPASNRINDVAVDQQGRWWCATTDAGLVAYDGDNWERYGLKQGFPSNWYNTVVVDHSNQVWAGSAGGGLTMIDTDGNAHFYQSEYLAGSSSPNYIIINDLEVDKKNNVWLINRLASNFNILSVVTPEFDWYHFSKMETNAVSTLEIDDSGRVWVASDRNGLFVLDYGMTLPDPSDDNFNQGYNKAEGLWSNFVTAIRQDGEGTMWIGTEEGLNYWYAIGGETRLDSFYYNIISNNIKSIEVDAQNNVWVGTTGGISLIPVADRFRPENYTTFNSPLVSDIITSLTYDPKTGNLFIATPAGLSVLETGFKAAKGDDYSQIQIYPNPFKTGDPAEQLFISNLAQGSKSVKIFTHNGILVKDIPLDDASQGGFGGQAIWNGQNSNNEFVASGIYVILVYTEDGKKHLSKVAVIRE